MDNPYPHTCHEESPDDCAGCQWAAGARKWKTIDKELTRQKKSEHDQRQYLDAKLMDILDYMTGTYGLDVLREFVHQVRALKENYDRESFAIFNKMGRSRNE